LIVFSGAISYVLALWGIEKENLIQLLRLVKVSGVSA
jgi:hypothetical protein